MTTPSGPPTAMQISAATMPFQPGMDYHNPLHVLSIRFGPVGAEIAVPDSSVDKFLELVTKALREQVESARAARLGADRPGLLLPGMDQLPPDVLEKLTVPGALG